MAEAATKTAACASLPTVQIPPADDAYWNVPLFFKRITLWDNLRRMDRLKTTKQVRNQRRQPSAFTCTKVTQQPPLLTGCPYGCVTGLPCPVAYVFHYRMVTELTYES